MSISSPHQNSAAEELLARLPAPPPGKTGWPWTLAGSTAGQQPDSRPLQQLAWPKISIVTPSFGQGHFIEETLRSVLLQGYPNLEYFVIDGGSHDQTVELLQKYAAHLTGWVSEPDRGQTHAVNKGFDRATGDVIAWLNSDDIYLPGALHKMGRAFAEQPHADVLYGAIRYMNEQGVPQERHAGRIGSFKELADLWEVWWGGRQVVQPEVFWRRKFYERCGPLDESLFYVMDYEYWLRLAAAGARFVHLPEEVASFRRTATQKSTASEKVAQEHLAVLLRYLQDPAAPFTWANRVRRKADWVYVTKFLATAEACDRQGLSTLRRWLRLAGTALRDPRMLLSSGFHYRARFSLQQKLGKLVSSNP